MERERSRTFRESWPDRAMTFAAAWYTALGFDLDEIPQEGLRRRFISVLRARVRELGSKSPISETRVSQLWNRNPTGHAGEPLHSDVVAFLESWLWHGVAEKYAKGKARLFPPVDGRVARLGPDWQTFVSLDLAHDALSDPSEGALQRAWQADGGLLGARFGPQATAVPPTAPEALIYPTWGATYRAIEQVSLSHTGSLKIRMLGLTMNRAWDPLTRELLPAIRRHRAGVPVSLDLFQLDPDWVGTEALHRAYPKSCRRAASNIMQSLPRIIRDHDAPVRVRFRTYRQLLGITGLAIGEASYFVGLVGAESLMVANGRPYFAVQGTAPVDNWLRTRFEECWAAADEEASTREPLIGWDELSKR